MTKNGYALVRDADGAELAWWETIPPRIDVPDTTIVAFGATAGWEAAGYRIAERSREFTDPPEIDPVLSAPIIVAASSAKLVLDDDGLYTQVEGICRNHPVLAVRIFWESANTWTEDNAYVQAIGTELGLDDDAIHSLFERARLK